MNKDVIRRYKKLNELYEIHTRVFNIFYLSIIMLSVCSINDWRVTHDCFKMCA